MAKLIGLLAAVVGLVSWVSGVSPVKSLTIAAGVAGGAIAILVAWLLFSGDR